MKFRIKEGLNQYDVVAYMITDMAKKIYKNYCPGDLIVRMGIKYVEETGYDYDNYLLYQSDFGCDHVLWQDDWCEGQRDIDLIGFIPVDEVEMKYMYNPLLGIIRQLPGEYRGRQLANTDYILKNFEDRVDVIND